MKLNLGCGRNVKEGFINVDAYERENKLDVICDLSKSFPFEDESSTYIYAEQLIEHLEWLDGPRFLKNCYRCLQPRGTLRLVFPDYRKIFQKYLEGDKDYFKVFIDELNQDDYNYYNNVYNDPEKVRKERRNNPPPEWHLSPKPKDRERLLLRMRHFNYLIEIVDWFVHQFGEHKTLYDFESIGGILKDIGFSEVKQTGIIKGFDSEVPSRMMCSMYVEAIK